MRNLIILFFLLSYQLSNAQVTQEWVKDYPMGAYGGMALDSSGNIAVVGWENGNMTTIKYSPLGQVIWKRTYIPPSLACWPKAIAIDTQGNIYVAGSQFQYTVVKYDSSGTEQWVRIYNSPYGNYSEVHDMTVDDQANVYVTGQSWTNDHKFGYVTVKYNTNGDSLWVASYRGPGNGDFAKAIAVDNDESIYITGHSAFPDTFFDFTTVKFDSNGALQWVRKYTDSKWSWEEGRDIAISNNNIIVTGFVGPAICTIKYNKLGDSLWTRLYSLSEAYDEPTAIAINSKQDVVITGSGVEMGNRNFRTVKYDSTGNLLWSVLTPSTDQVTSVFIDLSDNIYLCGSADSSMVTVKYNEQGNFRWREDFGGNTYSGNKVIVDENSSVFVYGGHIDSIYHSHVIKYSQTISVKSISSQIPDKSILFQNYPNPFNPSTKIRFNLRKKAFVELIIYDILGKEINQLIKDELNPSIYEKEFLAVNLPSGVYYYQLKINHEVHSIKKMVLIK